MSNNNAVTEKKVWLKVIKTGLIFEEFESIAKRKDPRLFETPTKEEVEKWVAGKFWKRADPKPVEATESKDNTDFKKILAEMQSKIEKLEKEKLKKTEGKSTEKIVHKK